MFGAIIVLIPAAQGWYEPVEQRSWRRIVSLFAAATIPITLVGCGLMLYNDLRFDNPFEFGWHYMLTSTQNATTPQFSLGYLWINVRFYFLEPMRWTSHFPFLQAIPLSPMPPGYIGVGIPYGGILSNCPISWLALAAPLAWKRGGNSNKAFGWFGMALFLQFVFCAATICLFAACSTRYQLDFLPDLMLLAVIGVIGLEQKLAYSKIRRRLARGVWCLLLAYSILFNALTSAKAHATANYISGNFFMNRGQLDRAADYFKKAVALDHGSAVYHFALANALSRSGRIDASVLEYKKALEIKPDYAEAANNLGYTLIQNGRVADSIVYFQQAVKIEQSYEAYYNLGYAYRRNGLAAQAIACYRRAMALQPQFLPPQISLAWMLATWPDPSVRNGTEAVALAGRLNQLANGADPKILRTLAAAYAEAGRFPEAVATAKQALALAQSNAALENELQTEVELFQNHSPYRTTSN